MKILFTLPLAPTLKKSLTCVSIHQNDKKFNIENLRTFALHGCTCVRCGRTGTKVIAWEDKGHSLHVDLFAESDGKLVMMNRDHIVPKSLRGANSVWNYQPMCIKCNCKKGNVMTVADKHLSEFRTHWRAIHIYIHDNWWNVFYFRCLRKTPWYKLNMWFRQRYLHKITHLFAKMSYRPKAA